MTRIVPNNTTSGTGIAEIAHPMLTNSSDRTAALKQLFSQSEIYDMGPEFRLLVRLIMSENGEIEGTYSEIGKMVVTEARNVRSWIAKLEQRGLLRADEIAGRYYKLTLQEPYLSATKARDKPIIKESETTEPDPELERLTTAYHASKATGSTMRILTEMEIGNGKSPPKV